MAPRGSEGLVALVEALDVVEDVLRRLDRRRHVVPARLEVSRHSGRHWLAQVMADPLLIPLAATGISPADAICSLAERVVEENWRGRFERLRR